MMQPSMFDRVTFLEAQVRELTSIVADMREQMKRRADIAGNPAKKQMSMREITAKHAKRNRLLITDMMGPNASRKFAHPRQDAWVEMRDAGYSFPQIAHLFKRDHTTIMHGVSASKKRNGLMP